MIWTLARKELLSNLLTLRLAVALTFTVVLSVTTALIGSAEYSRNVDRFDERRREVAAELDGLTTWQQYDEPTVFLPPEPLSILGRGLSESAGYEFGFALDWSGTTFWPITGADSDMMQSLVRIDFTSVIALLLSFLAVVLAYDGICGERERGTLQLVMTNAVPRMTLLAGKILGGLLSLWTPLALAFTVALLILLTNPDVSFSGDDWIRVALFFLLSCLFLAQVFLFGLAVSASTRTASTSLVVCLFFWLLAGVGWANVLPSLSRYGVDEPPFQEFIEQDNALWEEFQAFENDWDEKNPPPDDLYFSGYEEGGLVRYYHPRAYEWLTRKNTVLLPKRLEIADKRIRAWDANQMPLAREGLLVDIWSVVSPLVNYQVLSYQLARTTLDDRLFAGKRGDDYRDTLFDWMRTNGVFGSRRWFTDDPLDQEPLIPDPEALTEEERQPDSEYMQRRRDWMTQQQASADDDDRRQLDTTDMPKFGGRDVSRSLSESLVAMAPGLLSLVGLTGLIAFVLMWRFATYDPGR